MSALLWWTCLWFLGFDPLNVLQLPDSALVHHVRRVERRCRLEQEHLGLRIRHGPMLDTARHNDDVTGRQVDRAISKFHAKRSAMHQEQLVLVIVMMPYERSGELDELHLLPVQLSDDPRIPLIIDRRKFFREGYL